MGNTVAMQVALNWKEKKQKLLIHALLACSELNEEIIAALLETPVVTIKNVSKGRCFFKPEEAIKLIKLFLMRFSDEPNFI